MARPRKRPVETPVNDPGSDPAPAPQGLLADETGEPMVHGLAEGPGETEKPEVDRITLLLDSEGRIQTESMRQKTKDKLRAALAKTPDLAETVKPAVPVRFPDQAIVALYMILGTVEVAIASPRFGAEIASKVFPYSPSEIGALMEPTQAVLSKYAGSMVRWQEELTLAFTLVGVNIAKLRAANVLLAARERDTVNVSSAEGVQ